MSNDETGDSEKVKNSKPIFDLSKIKWHKELDSPIGPLELWPVTMESYLNIKSELGNDESGNQIYSILRNTLFRKNNKDDFLTIEEVAILSENADFLEDFISQYPAFFRRQKNSVKAASDFQIDTISGLEILKRNAEEPPSGYILRGWSNFKSDAGASFEKLGNMARGALPGLSSVLSQSGRESLGRSMSAADRLSEAIKGQDSIFATMRVSDRDYVTSLGDFKNPIHETNEHLQKVTLAIEQMRKMAEETAIMQRGLNDVAAEILEKFVEGARASETSSKNNLGIAKAALWVSIISLIVTIFVPVYSWLVNDSQESSQLMVTELQSLRHAEEGAQQQQIELMQKSVERLESIERRLPLHADIKEGDGRKGNDAVINPAQPALPAARPVRPDPVPPPEPHPAG